MFLFYKQSIEKENISQMDKQLKQNFIQLPLNAFKKKSYPIPHFLFQTKLQKSQKNLLEIKKLIEAQEYEYIGQISDQRNLYCCKEKTNDRLVVIQIKQVGSKNNKNIYLSINLTPALKKDIKKYFMLKTWRILDKIYLQDQKGSSGLVLLLYNFVQKDLRNLLKRQLQLNQKISNQQITKICQDVIQNLCSYHLQSTAILDIRPQTIMYEDGKWFILNGDTSITNKLSQFGSSISKSIGFKPVSCLYLSPLMYESFIKNQPTLNHNPYKSDVYSLGLIIWQLLRIGVFQPMQIKSRLQNRKQAHVIGIKQEKCFNLRQKIILQNNKPYVIPNVLRMMLQESQQQRCYIVETCLCLNFTSSLFSKILVPFEKYFKKQVIDYSSSSRKKMQYPHVGIEYQGDTIEVYDELIKNGRGTITHNNIKIFDGEWKNNLPHGKCNISFSQSWNYEGMLEEGKLHGQGVLTFNGIRIGGTKWTKNLQQQVISNKSRSLQLGYYLLCPQLPAIRNSNQKKPSLILSTSTKTNFNTTLQSFNETKSSPFMQDGSSKSKQNNLSSSLNQQYKIFFQQIHNEKSKYILNFTHVQSSEFSKLIQILLNPQMFLSQGPFSIQLFEEIKYPRYSKGAFDLIRIGIKRNKNILQSQKNLSQSKNCIQQLDSSKKGDKNIQLLKEQSSSSKQLKKSFPCSQSKDYQDSSLQNKFSDIQYIDLIVSLNHGSLFLLKLLKHLSHNSRIFSSQQTNQSNSNFANPYILNTLDISYSTMSQDQFRDIIQTGINIKNLNISRCLNLNDNAVKYFSLNQTFMTHVQSLNLSHLKISNKSLQQLKFCNWLKKVTYLNISYCQKLNNQVIADFLCDQKLSNLQQLQIAGLALNHRGLQKISQHSKLIQLRKLNIGGCHQLGQLSILEFIKSKQLSKLEIFHCFSTTVKDVFLEELSNDQNSQTNKFHPKIQDLNLSGSINLTIYGISKFFLSKNSKSILNLNLSNLDITDDFVQLLGKRSLLNPNLIQLNLSSCYKISDKGIKELLKSQRLSNLKKLDLSKTNISNDTLFLLAQSTQRKLKAINFYKCCKMNDTGFQKFIMSPAISNVKKLQIGGTSIKSLFFLTIASQKASLSIQELYLNQCSQIDQKSLCQFLSSKRISEIRLLDLSLTKITKKIIQTINKNPYLKAHLLQLIALNCVHLKNDQLNDICIVNNFSSKINKKQQILKTNADDLSKSPLLLKMNELQLNNGIQNIQKLFQSNYIINLSKLQIKWQQCSLSLKSMSENIAFNSFKQLSLLGSKFDEQKLVELIKSTTVKNLQNLDLSWTDITNETLCALVNSQYITSLRHLNLSKCNNFNDKGLVKYIMSSKASLLLTLDLRSTLITNSSLQSLGKSKNIKSLAKLILRSCPNISQVGFREYFSSGNSSSLRELDVGWTRVSGNLFSYMSKSKSLQLHSLKLSGLKGIEFQLTKFISCMSSSSLTQIQMNYSQITCQTISSLSSSRYLQTLQKLQVLGYESAVNQQKFNGLIKLIQSTNMSKLTTLKLSFSNLPEKKGQIFLQSIQRNLHMIQKLSIIGSNQQTVQKANKMLKKCQVLKQQ